MKRPYNPPPYVGGYDTLRHIVTATPFRSRSFLVSDHSKDEPAKPASPDPTVPAADEPPANRPLTPEEQMAAYEKDLRENDWGHQPC